MDPRCLDYQLTEKEAVQFKDTSLKAKVCEALGKPAGAFLDGSDMTLLENLTAEKAGITDLAGLELATNCFTQVWLPLEKLSVSVGPR